MNNFYYPYVKGLIKHTLINLRPTDSFIDTNGDKYYSISLHLTGKDVVNSMKENTLHTVIKTISEIPKLFGWDNNVVTLEYYDDRDGCGALVKIFLIES